jgi:hypothetical protein
MVAEQIISFLATLKITTPVPKGVNVLNKINSADAKQMKLIKSVPRTHTTS